MQMFSLFICQHFLHCFLCFHGFNERLLHGHASWIGLIDPCFCFIQPGFIGLNPSRVNRKFVVNFLLEAFQFCYISSLSFSLRVCRSTLCSVLKSRISLLIVCYWQPCGKHVLGTSNWVPSISGVFFPSWMSRFVWLVVVVKFCYELLSNSEFRGANSDLLLGAQAHAAILLSCSTRSQLLLHFYNCICFGIGHSEPSLQPAMTIVHPKYLNHWFVIIICNSGMKYIHIEQNYHLQPTKLCHLTVRTDGSSPICNNSNLAVFRVYRDPAEPGFTEGLG